MKQVNNTTVISSGFGLGTLIAVALSWGANHSIIWAIIDGILGWLYVIYYFLFR